MDPTAIPSVGTPPVAPQALINAYLQNSEAKRESVARDYCTLAGTITSGKLFATAIVLFRGEIVKGIGFQSGSTEAKEPEHQWFALYSSALKPLGLSADMTTEAWVAEKKKVLGLTEQYEVTASGLFYLCGLVVAKTVPTIAASNMLATVGNIPPKLGGGSTAGLTTPETAPNPAAALNGSPRYYAWTT